LPSAGCARATDGAIGNKYILQASVRGKADVPGEHHFVALYLFPRLAEFSFLGIPHYINPDGMKGGAGDVIYYSYSPEKSICYIPTPRLRIEVKLENARDKWIQLTRLQYYQWIKQEWRPEDKGKPGRAERPDQPDLFLGVSRHGLALLPWVTFRDIYMKVAYPGGLIEIPPVKGRPAPTGAFPMSSFDWSTEKRDQFYFPYSKMKEWPQWEAKFVDSLEEQCTALTSQSSIQPLEIRPDL
jgi:hypothetical protein